MGNEETSYNSSKSKVKEKTPQSSVKAMKKLRESVVDDKIVASVKSKENTARPEGQKTLILTK